MSREKLKKAEEIYHAVLKISPNERNSFLQEHCGDDLKLRDKIESLLSYETDFDSLIDSNPKLPIAQVFAQEIPTKINQYTIEKKLSVGGMGEIFLAHDTKLERKVAIKLLSSEFSTDINRRSRFFQEAKAASALNHPNILTVHEIGEFESSHFIVTEFIKGRTLMNYLREEKLSLHDVLELATQIASALSAAHEAGIVHRDIKPDNIMVRHDGLVKMLDFGIAKLSKNTDELEFEGETQTKPLTTPGMIIGTPQYMSPEQARGQKVDLRTDIFSFGVVLYEMLCGKPPFSGATSMDIIGSILKDEPKPLSEQQPKIPVELSNIVEKTLRKDRDRRYQHVKDLFIDLNDVKKSIEFDTKINFQTEIGNAATTAQTTGGIVTERRFSLIHALIFLLVSSGIIGIIWWFWLSSSHRIEQLKISELVSWSSNSGEVYSVGSFSPDSKMIAFSSTKTGTKNIWIKQTNSGEAIQITKDKFSNKNPIWSSNGEEIAYSSNTDGKLGFWRIPILGGSPKLITNVDDGSSLLRYWSKNGLIYYESNGELFAIDVSSNQTKQITNLASDATFISISPDEKQITYLTIENEIVNVWTMNLADKLPKKLFSNSGDIRNTAWHPDNKRIFFSSLIDGTFQIFATDINGTPPKQLTFADSDIFVLDIATDGTKILSGSAKEESDIWGINLNDNKEFMVASDINSELWANVSPDGKNIAYQSIKNLSQGNNLFNGKILTKKLNSTEQPNEVVANGYLPIWSPDGEGIAYFRVVGGKPQIEVAQINGGQNKVVAEDISQVNNSILPYNRIQTSYLNWSPDSSKIVYISKKNEQKNVSIVNADGSNNLHLTDNQDPNLTLECPLLSADGKKIAYTSKTENTEGKATYAVWLIDSETKNSKLMTQSQQFLRLIGWTQNENELVFATTGGLGSVGLQPEVKLVRLEVKTGKIQEIAVLKETYLFNIHLSPNKKSFAFVAHNEGKDNLWLISANGGEAKKLSENNDSRYYFSSLAWSPDSNAIYFGKQSRYSLLSMISNFK